MSVAEAATFLGISRSGAYNLVTAGTLPTVKVGKRTLVPRKAAVEYAADRLQ